MTTTSILSEWTALKGRRGTASNKSILTDVNRQLHSQPVAANCYFSSHRSCSYILSPGCRLYCVVADLFEAVPRRPFKAVHSDNILVVVIIRSLA